MEEEKEGASIEIGGIKFTGGRMVAIFMGLSAAVGSLYGAFEVYKDYMDMKQQIQDYVTPDLSEIYKKLAVLEQNSASAVEFTRDTNNNLKQDIRRIEGVVESVERGSKQVQREVAAETKEIRDEMRAVQRELDTTTKQVQRDLDATVKQLDTNVKQVQRELNATVSQAQREIDTKIRKALDNPLAN